MAEMIQNQRLLGVFNSTLDGLKLLSYFQARAVLLDHFDNRLHVAMCAF
jgi:hypothetical protein